MQKVFMLFVLGLAFFLSSCGALIPDQNVENVFGLDGKSVTLSQQQQIQQAGLAAQAVAATFSGAISASFNDFDQSIPGGIRPTGISENVGLEATVRVASATATSEADFPSTLNIVASQLNITVADGSGQPTINKAFNSVSGLSIALNKGSCTVASGVTCTYTINATNAILLLAQLVGSEMGTFYTIISSGGEPNTVTGTFSISVDALFPANSQVTVVLNTSDGVLTF
jgi:hypothetical protein